MAAIATRKQEIMEMVQNTKCQSQHLPAVDTNHNYTRYIEADTAGNHSVGRCQVKSTRWILSATIQINYGRIRSVQAE